MCHVCPASCHLIQLTTTQLVAVQPPVAGTPPPVQPPAAAMPPPTQPPAAATPPTTYGSHAAICSCLQLPCCHLLNRLWPLHCFQAQSHLCLSQRSACRKDLLCPSQRFCGLSGLAMPTPEVCSLWGPIRPTIAWAAQPQLAAPSYRWSSAMPRRHWTCGRHQNFFSATARSAAGHQNNFSTAAGPGSHVLLWV